MNGRILIIALLSVCAASAQQKNKPASLTQTLIDSSWIGLIADPNFNNLSYFDKYTTIAGNNISFHVGILFQKKINRHLSLQPQFIFSLHGGKIINVDSTINAELYYVGLPLYFFYREKDFYMGLGPCVYYGISGKLKSNSTTRNIYPVAEAKERTLKRFEAGANLMAQYQWKSKYLVSVNYFFGLSNIYKGDHSTPADLKARTKSLEISIGYLFGVYAEKK